MFRKASAEEHEKILEAEKKVWLVRIICWACFLLIVVIPYVRVVGIIESVNRESAAKVPDYMEGFNETEETIIRELYGSADEYADKMLWDNKKDFLDKEKTTQTGEMTYDEAAMEEYRNQMIKDFEAKIDHDKVVAMLEERKESYREANMAQAAATEVRENDANKVKSEVNMLAIVALVVLAWGLATSRFMYIKNQKYVITDGRIVEKRTSRRSDVFIRRRAFVEYEGIRVKVILTYWQALSTHVGEQVYLIRTNAKYRPMLICKK